MRAKDQDASKFIPSISTARSSLEVIISESVPVYLTPQGTTRWTDASISINLEEGRDGARCFWIGGEL